MKTQGERCCSEHVSLKVNLFLLDVLYILVNEQHRLCHSSNFAQKSVLLKRSTAQMGQVSSSFMLPDCVMQTLLSALMALIPSNRWKSRGFPHITSTSIMTVLPVAVWILMVPLLQQACVAPVNMVTICFDQDRNSFALRMEHEHPESKRAEHGVPSMQRVIISSTEFTCFLGNRPVLLSHPQLHFRVNL